MPTMTLSQTCVMAILQAIAVVIFIFIVVPLTTFAERKVLGYVQDRLGATRIAGHLCGLTGWLNRGMWRMGKVPFFSIVRGLPVFVGDIIKLLVKEDIIPDKADRTMFMVAPGPEHDRLGGGVRRHQLLPGRPVHLPQGRADRGRAALHRLHHRHERGPAVHPGRGLGGRLRHRPGRLGLQLQVSRSWAACAARPRSSATKCRSPSA